MARTAKQPPALVTAKQIARRTADRKQHAINRKAVRHQVSLGDLTGMTTLGFYMVRIEPGDETTEFHTHFVEEEFVYILSGRGLAEIGDDRVEVGPGDFMGFRAGAACHSMSNPFKEPLVYLMGGTRQPFDVVDYPRAGVRSYKHGAQRDNVKRKAIDETRR